MSTASKYPDKEENTTLKDSPTLVSCLTSERINFIDVLSPVITVVSILQNTFTKIFDNYDFTIFLACFCSEIKKPTQKIEWENCYEKEKCEFIKKSHAQI